MSQLPTYINLFFGGLLCSLSAFGAENCEISGGSKIESVVLQPELGFEISWTQNPEEVLEGTPIHVVRCLASGKTVHVGNGYITGQNEIGIAASVQLNSGVTELNQIISGNAYKRPMVGDFVVAVPQIIAVRHKISPKFEARTENLFEEAPSTDLSFSGKQLIDQYIESLGKNELNGKLIVTGFANSKGPREALRRDTQVQAYIVSRYLIQRWKLNEDQVIAVGVGSDQFVPTNGTKNGIRIKVTNFN